LKPDKVYDIIMTAFILMLLGLIGFFMYYSTPLSCTCRDDYELKFDTFRGEPSIIMVDKCYDGKMQKDCPVRVFHLNGTDKKIISCSISGIC